MTDSLYDAVRAEMRARLGLVRTASGLDAAFEALAKGAASYRASVETSAELAQLEGAHRQLLADLLGLELLIEELGDQLAEHRSLLRRHLPGPQPR